MAILEGELFYIVGTAVFIFAMIFALLTRSEVLKNKGSNMIIALVIAAFTSQVSIVVNLFRQFLPLVGVLLVISFFYVFMKSILAGKNDGTTKDYLPTTVFLGIALILVASIGDNFLGFFNIPTNQDTVLAIALILIIIIFYLIYKIGGDRRNFPNPLAQGENSQPVIPQPGD